MPAGAARELDDGPPPAHEQADDEDDEKHKEQYFCDTCSRAGDSAEAKQSGYERYNQKNDRVMKHLAYLRD